jgi:hypothetical protein
LGNTQYTNGTCKVYRNNAQSFWSFDFCPSEAWKRTNINGSNARTWDTMFVPCDTREQAIQEAQDYAKHIGNCRVEA